MNSFNTDDDTKKIIRKYQGFRVQIYTFNQSCFPRINRESFLPIAKHSEVESNMEAYVKCIYYVKQIMSTNLMSFF